MIKKWCLAFFIFFLVLSSCAEQKVNPTVIDSKTEQSKNSNEAQENRYAYEDQKSDPEKEKEKDRYCQSFLQKKHIMDTQTSNFCSERIKKKKFAYCNSIINSGDMFNKDYNRCNTYLYNNQNHPPLRPDRRLMNMF